MHKCNVQITGEVAPQLDIPSPTDLPILRKGYA